MKKHYRWIYVIIGIMIFICLGTVYSWSIFRKPLENSLELSSTQSGLPFMTFLVFYSLLMPVGGRLISRYNPRWIIVLGGILVGLGWIFSSYSKNVLMLVVTYGVIAGSGVGIAYGVPIGVVSKWFPDKQGFALGILLSGFGLSPFVTAPIAKRFIDLYGPFITFKILGISFLVLITLLSLPFKFPQDTKTIENQDKISFKPSEMLKTKSFYILWTCFSIATLIGLMIIGITSPIGEEIIKINSRKIAFYVSIFSIFNGLGRPIFGYLTDKVRPVFAISASFILIIIASVIMMFMIEGGTILFVLSLVLFWLNFGGWLAIAPSLTSKLFGRKYYSQNYGIVFTAYGFGAVAGNLMSGVLKDYLGSYKYVSYPIFVLALVGLVLSNMYLKDNNKSIKI